MYTTFGGEKMEKEKDNTMEDHEANENETDDEKNEFQISDNDKSEQKGPVHYCEVRQSKPL